MDKLTTNLGATTIEIGLADPSEAREFILGRYMLAGAFPPVHPTF